MPKKKNKLIFQVTNCHPYSNWTVSWFGVFYSFQLQDLVQLFSIRMKSSLPNLCSSLRHVKWGYMFIWNLSKQSLFFNHFIYSYLNLFKHFLQEWTLNLSSPEKFILYDNKSILLIISGVSVLNNPIGLLVIISTGRSFPMG